MKKGEVGIFLLSLFYLFLYSLTPPIFLVHPFTLYYRRRSITGVMADVFGRPPAPSGVETATRRTSGPVSFLTPVSTQVSPVCYFPLIKYYLRVEKDFVSGSFLLRGISSL